ncbi:cbb3-type cytochrome c oxidase subunit I [Dechloromonas sp. XY25]|uniref:Cbb3-type cytochrome c oxidase subunit I n=1 Tax=Dechloromonas hankyongensis TaxID=2908002 RepID=A0ABS9K1W9_9RHOO|nr:cbb3-type cytochrome c oxidase subunit I [Dechloromonas hankyongensis]MCG2577174.1 cbb3-type cytochrome c oxidase subunit I [Dechloromonas hankyongensis]
MRATVSCTQAAISPAFEAAERQGAVSGALSAAWWLLALLALGASTLCAVVLVVARTPFLGLGAEFFRSALVLHVDLAVVVWFLAVAAGLWLTAMPAGGGVLSRMARAGVWLAGLGVLAMVLSPLDGQGVPVLANYVPVLDTPSFYIGLGTFLSGVGFTGVACLLALAGEAMGSARRPPSDGGRWVMAAAIVAFLSALVIFVLAARGGAGEVSLDTRLWGGGHLLQIVHTLMLMAAWLHLGRPALGRVSFPRRWVFWLIAMELLAVVADLLIALAFPVDSLAYRRGFTLVMRWLTWPAPLALAVWLVFGYARLARRDGLRSQDFCLLGSIALFVLGCLVGAAIRGETTTVPAHYHGTVGAVTLAYMTWAQSRLSGIARGYWTSRLWRWQPLVYGLGIGLMVVGLTWAGTLGVPRKSPHAETVMADGVHHVAMGLAGTGGLLATVGAAVFVAAILLALGRKRIT